MPRPIDGYMKIGGKRTLRTALKKVIDDVRVSPNRRLMAISYLMMMDAKVEVDYQLMADVIRSEFTSKRGIELKDKEDPAAGPEKPTNVDKEANTPLQEAFDALMGGETKWVNRK